MKAKTAIFLWVLFFVLTIGFLFISEWLAFFPLIGLGYISNYLNKNIKRFSSELKLID